MYPLNDHAGIHLLPEGAILLSCGTLVVADIHLGKSATFRARGLPVPEGDTQRDLQRLNGLVAKHRPSRVVIAGDLFHAAAGMTPEIENALMDFLNRSGTPMVLVTGNHDARIAKLPQALQCVPHLEFDGVRIVHDPDDLSGDAMHIAGHWHPVVRIADGKRTSLRLPCFLLRGNLLVLPAYGSFTGGAVLDYTADDRVFVALRDEVVELPASLVV